ncbi:hypothetical protein RFI_37424, partial [Reticulomyxa filosa]
ELKNVPNNNTFDKKTKKSKEVRNGWEGIFGHHYFEIKNPVLKLLALSTVVTMGTVMLYRTGWRQYNDTNERVYFNDNFAFIILQIFVGFNLLVVFVWPFHLFTHRPPQDFRRGRLLMIIMGVPWILLIVASRVFDV